MKEWRFSGKVIIVTVKNKAQRREIMVNKRKLKEGIIYIERDLSWKERKIQKKINR